MHISHCVAMTLKAVPLIYGANGEMGLLLQLTQKSSSNDIKIELGSTSGFLIYSLNQNVKVLNTLVWIFFDIIPKY